MEFYKFCVGLCPFCNGQGILIPVQINNEEIHFVCSEAYHEFESFKHIKKRKTCAPNFDDRSISFDEFIAKFPHLKEHTYIFNEEDMRWVNLINPDKTL